jgi:hypothetical protein
MRAFPDAGHETEQSFDMLIGMAERNEIRSMPFAVEMSTDVNNAIKKVSKILSTTADVCDGDRPDMVVALVGALCTLAANCGPMGAEYLRIAGDSIAIGRRALSGDVRALAECRMATDHDGSRRCDCERCRKLDPSRGMAS